MGAAYELTATVRQKVGKGAARSVRREGQIPAVIYGGEAEPVSISLNEREIRGKIQAGGFYTSVATIDVGGEKIITLPRDYQLDPVSDRPMHVDFLRVEAGAEVAVEVPVHFINEIQAPGIKRGGVLNVVRHRIALYVKINAIPEFVTADLTGLDIGDSLHISKIALPEGARPTITGRNFTIATIAAAAGVKEEMREAAAAKAATEAAATATAEGAAPAEGAPAAAGADKAAAGKAPAGKADAKAPAGKAPAGKSDGGKK